MDNKPLRRKVLISAAVIFILLTVIFYEHILGQVGRFLVFEQKPLRSDVIVVLNGRDTERSLAAVDLYNNDYANLIVLARGSKQPGCDEFWKRVGKDFSGKIFFQRAIEAMGIPEEAFRFIGDGVTSTYDEAVAARKFIKTNGYQSILLVTSKWHSKRAYLTFQSTFANDGVRITMYPSKYDTFNSNAWWKKEADIELVLREYVRFIYYILTFRISLLS